MQTRPTTPAQTVAEFIADLDDGTFTHRPRAPEISARYPDQRYFAHAPGRGASGLSVSRMPPSWRGSIVTVYRDAHQDHAELGINLMYVAKIDLPLTADELRAVACMCLDAAHDLDTLPAAVLAEQAEREAA